MTPLDDHFVHSVVISHPVTEWESFAHYDKMVAWCIQHMGARNKDWKPSSTVFWKGGKWVQTWWFASEELALMFSLQWS